MEVIMKKKLSSLLLASAFVRGGNISVYASDWHSQITYSNEGSITQGCRQCSANEIGVKRSVKLGTTYGYSWISDYGNTVQSEVNVGGNTLAGSKSSSGYSQTGTAKHNDKYAKVSEEHKIF